MRRFLLALLVAVVLGTLTGVTDAGHGHWHGGWRGGYGHGWNRGYGWGVPYRAGYYGGWGGYYGGGVSIGLGWPGYGYSYLPAYGYGYPGCNTYCAPVYNNCYGYSGGAIGVYPAYGVSYSPRANYVGYFVDSSYEPAELAYGPLAVKQFLGLDRNFALGELRRSAAPLEGKIVRLKVRTSNAESRRKAERYIAIGDELFAKQNWHSAMQKYKLAGQLAPDVAECYWRQGHALIAVNQYGQAASVFRRALMLNDDTSRNGFQLSDLYVDGEAAKNSHLESLAGEALGATVSADAYFLIGITLHYNGEQQRAQKFFQQAAVMSSEDGQLVKAFMQPKKAPSVPALVLPVKADEMEI
jgi:hypothetical protein